MKRFETENGKVSLGVRFAGKVAGKGEAVFHLNEQEVKDLFNLDLDLEVFDDGCPLGMTVEDLMNEFVKGKKADSEMMERQWNKTLKDSLHFGKCETLDKDGNVQTFFTRFK